MSEVRTKLFAMVAMAAPTHDLHWRMTPMAVSKVQAAEDRVGDLIVIVPNVRPLCLGIPVEIVQGRWKAAEIALNDDPLVAL